MGESAGVSGPSGIAIESAVADTSVRTVRVPLLSREVAVGRVYIALALVLLNICDVLLTKGVLHLGGVEANPLMQGLMAGMAAPLGFKAIAAATAGMLLMACPPASRFADRAAAAVAGLYLGVVVWNSALLAWLLAVG